MCGILGLASADVIGKIKNFSDCLNKLQHRGPDNGDIWRSPDSKVLLGHRRLSIIDLSPQGNQPMRDAQGHLCITFNGEIYNFRSLRSELSGHGFDFVSYSDTEVILKAYQHWGKDCVQHFRGMFAFAIHDAENNTIFVARDRAGEKPFFYCYTNTSFSFSSELKSLLDLESNNKPRLNYSALDCYLSMGYVPNDICILQGYNKLPPGHAGIYSIDNNKFEKWRYWGLPKPERFSPIENMVDASNKLTSLLNNSVKGQLVADVPVGILLSGGLDSSIITGLASRHSDNINTFSVTFPNDSSYDESGHARLIASHYKTNHHELSGSSISCEDFISICEHIDEPMVDSSLLPTTLLTKLVGAQCKVALGGDGGDELFGGYKHYSRLLKLQKYMSNVPKFARQKLSKIAARAIPFGVRGYSYINACAQDFNIELPQIYTLFSEKARKSLIKSDYGLYAEKIRSSLVPRAHSLLDRATRYDFENYLAEDILVKIDRASMYSSLELRAPFLDHKVIEFAFTHVPNSFKATESQRKIILRESAKSILPDDFNYERKQGFDIPLNKWLKQGPIRSLFMDSLLAKDAFFNTNFVRKLFKELDSGMNHGERLFALFMLQTWLRKYSVVY